MLGSTARFFKQAADKAVQNPVVLGAIVGAAIGSLPLLESLQRQRQNNRGTIKSADTSSKKGEQEKNVSSSPLYISFK